MRKGVWALNKLQLLQLLADIMYANRQAKPDHEVKKVIHRFRAWRRWACRMLKFSRMCLPTFAKPVLYAGTVD